MNTKVLQDKYTKIKQVPGVSTARLFLSHVSHEVTPSKKLSKTAWFVHVHNNQVKPIAHQVLIFAFSFQDSATYSCVSDLAPPATVQLVVTEGVRTQNNIFENQSHFHPEATFFAVWAFFWDISSLDHLLCNFSHSLPFSDHMRSALVSFNSGRTTSLPSLPHFFLLLLFLFSSSTVCTWTQCLLVATIPLLDQINFSNLFPISPLLELDLWECLYSLSSCMKMGPGWHPSKLPRVFLLLLSIETECSKFPLAKRPLKNISILSWDMYVSSLKTFPTKWLWTGELTNNFAKKGKPKEEENS